MSQYYQGPPQQGNYPQGPRPPGASFPQDGPVVPVERKSEKTAIIAGVLTFALLVGGDFLAWLLLRGVTPAATKGIPSSALVMFEVNLNPPAGDKLAVKELAAKSPLLKDEVNDAGNDYKKALWSVLAKTDKSAPDYESEARPWLDDSLAIAALSGKDSSRSGLNSYAFSVQVTNKNSARAFTDKYIKDRKIVFVGDLMAIASDKDSDISESSLKNNITSIGSYKADMSKLGDGFLTTVWISSDLVEQTSEFGKTGSADVLESRFTASLKIQDGVITLRTITWQEDEIKDHNENVRDLAGSMPANWLGSPTFSLLPSLVNKMWESINSLPASSQCQLRNFGISLVGGLHALVGTQFSVALTGDSSTLRAGFRVHTKNPEKHKSIVEKITRTGSLKDTKTTVKGDTVTTTFGTDVGTFSDPDEELSTNSDYEKLIKGIDNPQAAAWVNIPQILKTMDKNSNNELPRQLKGDLESISGIEMVTGRINDHYFDPWARIGTK